MADFFYERLDDIFERRKICSGRRLKRFLQQHNFCVNGRRVFSRGQSLALFHDQLTLDGKDFKISPDLTLVMNKAQSCLCTKSPGDYKRVYDYLKKEYFDFIKENNLPPLHTIGRLDGNTEGLLIFTTNGSLSHKIQMPENSFPKKYFVILKDPVCSKEKKSYLEKCHHGLEIPALWKFPPFTSAPAEVLFEDDFSCQITVTEGKFHEVKRIFAALGNTVTYLKRISMGAFSLPEELCPGQSRVMTEEEILFLLKK